MTYGLQQQTSRREMLRLATATLAGAAVMPTSKSFAHSATGRVLAVEYLPSRIDISDGSIRAIRALVSTRTDQRIRVPRVDLHDALFSFLFADPSGLLWRVCRMGQLEVHPQPPAPQDLNDATSAMIVSSTRAEVQMDVEPNQLHVCSVRADRKWIMSGDLVCCGAAVIRYSIEGFDDVRLTVAGGMSDVEIRNNGA